MEKTAPGDLRRAEMMLPVTLVASIAQAQGGPGDYMDWGWGWGGWLAMSLMMGLFWIPVVAFGVWAIRSTSHHHEPGPSGRSGAAMDVARERYARGEISEEEFQQIKRGLS
jgi:putative membrane protein